MSNPYLLPKVPVTVVQIGGSNNFSASPNNTGAAVNVGVGGNIFTINTSSVNTVGINNLGVGGNIFVRNTIGTNNIGIGGNIFGSNVTGTYNIGIGNNSGNSVLGSYNTMVGSNTGQQSTDSNVYNNSTALGYGAVVNASNQIVLGTTTESVVIPSITPANNSTSGALVVGGGMGVGGNAFIGGSVSPLQYLETVYNVTPSWSGTTGSLTVNYNNGLLYWLTTGTTGTITSLTLNNIPSISGTSLTFAFMINTTSPVGYISTGSVTVNGISCSMVSSTISGTPSTYILQTIHLFNIGGIINTLITSASVF
jgi:hypothetical protein